MIPLLKMFENCSLTFQLYLSVISHHWLCGGVSLQFHQLVEYHHVSNYLNMSCRCPITWRCPMRRYLNMSPRFSKIMVSVLLEKESALETCTFLHSFGIVSMIVDLCSTTLLYRIIYFLYLFLKMPLCGCIIQRRITLQTWYAGIFSN